MNDVEKKLAQQRALDSLPSYSDPVALAEMREDARINYMFLMINFRNISVGRYC